MHIPDDPLFYEKFYFTPGDLGFRAWNTRFGKIGVLVCWDQWYPEGARLTALQGAQILFYPTAIGWHPSEKAEYGTAQHSAWETIQRSHAVANGCYVASVNRIGHEKPYGGDGIEFWGRSFVADTSGTIVAKASTDKEEILLAGRRPRPRRPDADPLAVPARPPDRRLRRPHPPVHRLEERDSPHVDRDHPGGGGLPDARRVGAHAATWLTWPRPEGISFPGRFDAIPGSGAASPRSSPRTRRSTSTSSRRSTAPPSRPPSGSSPRARPGRSSCTISPPTNPGAGTTARSSSATPAGTRPSSTGATTPGAGSTRRATWTTRCRATWRSFSGCRSMSRAS